MKSLKHGTDNLTSSVTAISKYGFWFLCEDKEYFISFSDYPVFKSVSFDKIFNIKFLSPKQLRLPDIDVDIELDSIENPERFQLYFE